MKPLRGDERKTCQPYAFGGKDKYAAVSSKSEALPLLVRRKQMIDLFLGVAWAEGPV